MQLPRFVLAGVPKAGTTSLYHYLAAQPGVHVSAMKEINFLSYPGAEVARERYPWLKFPITTLDEYAALFADADGRVPIDFSASCFRSEVAVARIREFVPDAGVLLLLRDPVERTWSAYQHQVRKGYERRSPDQVLVRGERIVDLGFYADRVAEFRGEFGADRVAVWLLDDLRRDPAGTLREILTHVGAQPTEPLAVDRVHNPGTAPRSRIVHRLVPDYAQRRKIRARVPDPLLRPLEWAWRSNQRPADPLPPDLESRLRTLYADDIRRLAGLLDRDLDSWLGRLPAR